MAFSLIDIFGPDDDEVAGSAANISPETYENRDAYLEAARQYNQNLPSYINQASDVMQEQAANEAYNQDKQIKANASNRGLLYSGLREGAESQSRSNIATSLANRRSQLNQQGMKSGFDTNVGAAGIGLDVADLERRKEDQRYRAMRAAQEQDPGLLGGFMSGLGGK